MRTYQKSIENLLETIENLSETNVTLYDKQLLKCATLACSCMHESQGDLGNKSKVNETYHNHLITSLPESNDTVYADIKSQCLYLHYQYKLSVSRSVEVDHELLPFSTCQKV